MRHAEFWLSLIIEAPFVSVVRIIIVFYVILDSKARSERYPSTGYKRLDILASPNYFVQSFLQLLGRWDLSLPAKKL